MLLRIRWFLLGAFASIGLLSYVANQMRKLKSRLTPRRVANSGLDGLARLLDQAATTVAPTTKELQ
jgi:hypothetical protein